MKHGSQKKIRGLNSINHRIKCALGLLLVMLLLTLPATIVLAAATDEMQVLLDADDGIDYDMRQNITTAQKNVRLTRGDLLIMADKIVYYGKTGIVEATGNVVYKTGETEYRTNSLTYNVLTKTGNSGVFSATLPSDSRKFNVKGQKAILDDTNAEFSDVSITRCPKLHPDYTFSASQIGLSGRRVQLKHVVVKIKGFPVFYFPILVFYTDYGIPELVPGYDDEYGGYKLKVEFTLADTSKREWKFRGELASKGDANIGLELGTKWGRSINKTDLLYYYWHDSWMVSNSYDYDTKLFTFSVDGSKEFNDDSETQLGVALTRKYWQSPLGEWQAGVFVRRALAEEDSGKVYGGTYSGMRLDYKPIENVKLSLLRIKSYSGNDYRDLMDDYGLGTNALYEVNVPLTSKYTFNMSGSYNLSDEKWYHEVYSITADYCCFQPTIGYDRADHSWEGGLKFKF